MGKLKAATIQTITGETIFYC